mgnify:CR=1 FL=1
MSDLVIQLEAEKAKRVAAILSSFEKIGHPELAEEFRAIVTLDNAIALVSRPAIRIRSSKASSLHGVNDTPAPAGFVLSDEVRRAIRKIKAERFRASSVYDILHDKWPTYITADKKPRIGATLSNLVTADELTVEKDTQRKSWYRIANLREVPKNDEDYITELGQLFTESGVMN